MTRRLGAAALVLALAPGVVACEEDNPAPQPLEPPSSVPSPSEPSPTESTTGPVAPTMPAEAKGTSIASAKAFVRYWVDALNYMVNSGDTTPLGAVSTADCNSCNNYMRLISEVYGDGGRFRSMGWTVLTQIPVPEQPQNQPILDIVVRQSPQRIVQQAGAEPERSTGGRQAFTVYLTHAGDEWRVSRLVLVS